jgi:osmoprotectant transport system ATP-binding protein
MTLLELRRPLGYVIQYVGLFPHMTVGENIGIVPHLPGWPKTRIATQIDELPDLVGLVPHEYRDRRPRALSGGQQRVGVARALAADPPVLLMDEPFGALDPITRDRLQGELLQIQRKLHKTIVIVTHDMDEAVRLADRISVLRSGKLVQQGSPAEVLTAPTDDFVAELLGRDRLLKLLRTTSVGRIMDAGGSPGFAEGGKAAQARVAEHGSLEEALLAMLAAGQPHIEVVGSGDHIVGSVTAADIMRSAIPR